jgi:hypothetical protein
MKTMKTVKTIKTGLIVVFLLTTALGFMSCSGGGVTGTGLGGGGGASLSYDGTYNCVGTTTTPAGSSPPASGSFFCLNGYCSEPSGAFSGNVDGNGNFSGTDKICSTCNPLPMSGQFSLTNQFTIHGSSGSVSATFNCTHSGGSGGGGGGGGTPPPAITSFTPPSGPPGTPVTLVGTNFPTFISDVYITVCGVPATILSATSTEIFFLIPDLSGTSCALTLTTSGGTVTAGNPFSVAPLILPSGSNVYWTEDGPFVGLVRMASINGGAITNISPALGGPGNIAVTNNGIFWIEDGSRALNSGAVRKVGLSGGSVTTLVTGLNNSPNMTVDSTNVYWTESFNLGSVQKIGINGGAISPIETGSSGAAGIAVDSTSVYWVDFSSGTVKKRGINGGSVITLASGRSFPYRIAVDATSVYWTEAGAAAGGAVMKCSNSIAGGPTTTLASGLSSPWSIAVDANNVYWSEYTPNGRIMKNAITGNSSTVITLASGLDSPKGIAVDLTSVYWAEQGSGSFGSGSIRKVPIGGGLASTIASGLGYPAYVAVYPH